MRRNKSLITVMILALAAFAYGQTAKRHSSHKPPAKVVLPPAPPGPLPQVPLDQLPAVPPRVTYQNDQLTIVAENSSLGDILREVHSRTGAAIDVPGNPAERVAMKVGPGPAREVLATLLNGTSYNYVMVGSPNDPAKLVSVMLNAKTTGGAETAQFQPPPTPQPNTDLGPGTGRPGGEFGNMRPVFQRPPTPAWAANQNANADDDADSDDKDDDDTDADAQQDQNVQQPQLDENGQPMANSGPKTPQQILQMMRNQQQQPGQPPQPGQQQPPQQQNPDQQEQ